MYDWSALNRSVKATIASGRVGQPVFVRWTAAAAQSEDDLKPLLAEMSAFTEAWLDAGARRLYATGAAARGHLSLALEFDNGGSALLALALAHGRPFMDLAVYGARGAIYHRDAMTQPRLEPGVARAGEEPLAAIDRSLADGQPVPAPGRGGRP